MSGKLSLFLLLVILTFLLAGCSNALETELPDRIKNLENLTVYPADAEPAHQITLSPDITYSDTGDVLFGPLIRGVEADQQGRAYVMDFTEKKVHLFDANGQFIKSMGREGRGPGEFLFIADIKVEDQQLHVVDQRQTKISVFDLETLEHQQDIDIAIDENENKPGWLERTRNNKTFYRPNDVFPLADEQYLVGFSDNGVATADNLPGRTYEFSRFNARQEVYSEHGLFSFDWTGGVLVHDQNDGSLVLFEVPYKRQSEFDVAGEELVYGWTEDFLFKVYDLEGNYQRAFFYPFTKVELNDELALQHYNNPDETLRSAIRNDTLPETFPAFSTMLLDDQQRLWVSSITQNPDENRWRVLDTEGRLLAQFLWPADRSIEAVQGDYVYTLERNPETGKQTVSRFEMELE